MPLEARGSELEQPFAFGVVRQLLEPVIDGRPRSVRRRGRPRGAPVRARRAAGVRRPTRASRRSTACTGWWSTSPTGRPLLVLVDDCHWVDHDSLRFLAYLAQRIEGLPVAMLLAGRPPVGRARVGVGAGGVACRRGRAVSRGRSASPPRWRWRGSAWARTRRRTFCRACHTATGGNPLFLRELLTRPRRGRDRAVGRRRERCPGGRPGGREPLRPASARHARRGGERAGAERSPCSATTPSCSSPVGVSGSARTPPPRRRTTSSGPTSSSGTTRLGFVHPDRARRALRGSRAGRAAGAARGGGRGAGRGGRIARAGHRAPAADRRDRGPGAGSRRSGRPPPRAARRGAPGAAAERLRRALAESPAEQERGEILAELGRYEVAAMQFEAAEEHLRAALASGADLTTRADAASMLARCAIVSGGRSAEAAVDALASLGEELRPLDPERSLELGSELLIVTTGGRAAARAPRRAPAALRRAGARPSRLRGGGADPRAPRSGSPREARPSRPPRRCRPPSRPVSRRPPATGAGFLALITLRLGERLRPGHAIARRRAGERPPRGPRDAPRAHPRAARRDRARAGRAQGRPGRGRDGTAARRRTALRRAAAARGGDRRRHRARRAGGRGRAGRRGPRRWGSPRIACTSPSS